MTLDSNPNKILLHVDAGVHASFCTVEGTLLSSR